MLSKFLQKLMFIKKFSINEGKIEILGDRYIMLNAANAVALQEIDKKEMYEKSKNQVKEDLSKLIKHAKVYENIKDQELKNIANLSKKIGNTDEGIVKTLETIFEIYGLGKLNVIKLENDKKYVLARIPDSTLAIYQKEKSIVPVCSITSGILAGIFSYLFNKDVDCVEKKCKGKGDEICEFEIS